jgi:aminopeptidase N
LILATSYTDSTVESTKEIVLNSHELSIISAKVKSTKAVDISYDKSRQRVTLAFEEDIPAAQNTTLNIKFQGTINNSMVGFYRSKYKPAVTPASSVPMDGEHHVMFSTQFESCDARRAFPCFDEPNLKATFDFGIEIPSDQIALSNMPMKKIDKSSKDGLQIVWFNSTPIMSTYLLAWAFGDFEYIEAFTNREYGGKHIPVRVYTTRGLKSQGQYALNHAPQIIDYFSEIFDIDYPLPKADLLAVHEFSGGAMENWGLVTYRTTAVLFDEETSSARMKNRVAYVVAHELAHQWFGNLVTMDWWNELWLNEGFATWVGWLAVDKLHPEWDVWAQYVANSMQLAFSLDAFRSSHPIDMPVMDALAVDQIFDAISYQKGSSVIRMLAADLGQAKFLDGVSAYLKTYSYGNATTKNLWDHVGKASGKDVATLMDPWIRKIGFPVLTVTENGGGSLNFKQSRYLTSGDVKPEEDSTRWSIPIGLVGYKGEGNFSLTATEDTMSGIDYSFYKVNRDTTGFYRTKYPLGRLAKIGAQVDRLSVSDKIGELTPNLYMLMEWRF